MEQVTFSEEEQTPSARAPRSPRGLYALAIRLGLARDEAGARVVLVVVALIAIAIAIIYPLVIL
jgi:hypothetical protein